MRKFTESDMETFEVIDGIRICPTGDYSAIKEFKERCSFENACSLGENCRFEGVVEPIDYRHPCSFENACSLGENYRFEGVVEPIDYRHP